MESTKKHMRLRDLREDTNLTQKQIAEVLGTTPQYYQKYEKGVRPITIDRLEQLANFYNTSTDYLLGRTSIRYPYPRRGREIEREIEREREGEEKEYEEEKYEEEKYEKKCG